MKESFIIVPVKGGVKEKSIVYHFSEYDYGGNVPNFIRSQIRKIRASFLFQLKKHFERGEEEKLENLLFPHKNRPFTVINAVQPLKKLNTNILPDEEGEEELESPVRNLNDSLLIEKLSEEGKE
jgi:hypothetical protein